MVAKNCCHHSTVGCCLSWFASLRFGLVFGYLLVGRRVGGVGGYIAGFLVFFFFLGGGCFFFLARVLGQGRGGFCLRLRFVSHDSVGNCATCGSILTLVSVCAVCVCCVCMLCMCVLLICVCVRR